MTTKNFSWYGLFVLGIRARAGLSAVAAPSIGGADELAGLPSLIDLDQPGGVAPAQLAGGGGGGLVGASQELLVDSARSRASSG
jgi:hypothetical protein